jgi:hypothetical protein
MLVSGIKSRPVYPGLKPDTYAKHNVILAEGAGAAAVIALMNDAPPGFAAKSAILFTEGTAHGKDYEAQLKALKPGDIWKFPTEQTLLFRFAGMLGAMTMGTRIYVTGTESFIGSAMKLAADHGVKHLPIYTEHRGSEARRVQCVHCKGFNENVTTNPCVCGHCGLNLLVRDHFSRRLNAFQGVCIDAETPGQVPAQEVVFK